MHCLWHLFLDTFAVVGGHTDFQSESFWHCRVRLWWGHLHKTTMVREISFKATLSVLFMEKKMQMNQNLIIERESFLPYTPQNGFWGQTRFLKLCRVGRHWHFCFVCCHAAEETCKSAKQNKIEHGLLHDIHPCLLHRLSLYAPALNFSTGKNPSFYDYSITI